LLKDLDYDNIEHYTIDDGPGGLLKPIITAGSVAIIRKTKNRKFSSDMAFPNR